ncbi:MAG: ABC transporter permease [Candidatus Nealsonbacteria bacterium]|nr:ABC transporter permease [Candidatus Nealsonbacteria bacterium]
MSHPLLSETRTASPVIGIRGRLFAASMLGFVALFVVGLVGLFAADISYLDADAFSRVLRSEDFRSAIWLSIWTTVVTTAIGLLFAIPMGYALSRYRFPGHALVDSIIDLPIILPPLVLGLSLLVFFFQTFVGRWIHSNVIEFALQPQGIVLCQFLVSASFGIRAIKLTFDGIDPRFEHVAMTLGCTRGGAFFRVALPMARRGIVVGGILIWTRAVGIYAPLQIFVGDVPGETAVLPTAIFLETSTGDIEVALAAALLMLAMATVALVIVRVVGLAQR